MLVAAAVCPHPPLIVPELAGSAASELDPLRAACAEAVRSLVRSGPDLLVVLGGAASSASFPGDAAGTFRPWGVDVRVGRGEPVLPLSLTVGRWVLDHSGLSETAVPVGFEVVAFDAPSEECAALGLRISRAGGRVAVLAMGDGSARLTEKSPGYLHPAAAPYDEMLADAIGNARTDRLAALDRAEAEELWVAGRAVFQVLAAAAGDRSTSPAEPPRPRSPEAALPDGVRGDTEGGMRGELLYQDAPYGVGYFVARWTAEEGSRA
ncbi:class III extradiol dioxygenase subunit B-like domain-containing protein [Microtetraspora sp. AC03309]|uniref:class III extradiol dioxygenase subunit B-like domain-containing protein n=1 Tax=Microtetraspora sp. AC03309 TaxID=2779376 RepID=UPI001E41955A|nr:class III extradiol dioxygenase subunit B-like domain-containing protein [Microtetraspora sp. AC03309]MCC5575182.1 class III extradiol dioxygenase subunit B-like domain-containing protein [Microtetraspora sp. AC03309]